MEKLVAGDVIVVPFPFTNLARAKRRPAFVLAALADGDYIFCQITSRAWPQSIPLRMSDLAEGTLPHDSYVRPEKLFTGNQTLVLSRVGHVKSAIQQMIHGRSSPCLRHCRVNRVHRILPTTPTRTMMGTTHPDGGFKRGLPGGYRARTDVIHWLALRHSD